jgi:hypothetical protein
VRTPLPGLTIILAVAALLLFWRLGAVYLWQDEANTAVLAVRMLKFGKPLAYDGVNLLTNDNFAAEDRAGIASRTTSAQAAIDYVVARGDVKPDTSWIFHPWGQFVAAAASIRLLGQTTVAARLPFALAALATVLLLYQLVRRSIGDVRVALLAAALLVANVEWIVHSRQARYYALSGLFLILTFAAYERWHRRARWGAPLFVATAWLWFQIDYGTVWPVLGVLFLHALVTRRRQIREPIVTGLVLAAGLAPFVVYYGLWTRMSVQLESWRERFQHSSYNIDLYVVPLIVLIAAIFLLVRRRASLAPAERRVVGLAVGILIALSLWVPSVAPLAFVRYVVMAAPLGGLIIAWVLVRSLGQRPVALWFGVAILVATPWLSLPLNGWAPAVRPGTAVALVRSEWPMAIRDIFLTRPDPNRAVVDWLRQHAAATDEILVNYEDAPLMYYLPNPIRGGVAAFRAEDESHGPPRFAVLRRSVGFVHWPVFYREVARYEWDQITIDSPDVIWGNNPDPTGKIENLDTANKLVVGRRREQ